MIPTSGDCLANVIMLLTPLSEGIKVVPKATKIVLGFLLRKVLYASGTVRSCSTWKKLADLVAGVKAFIAYDSCLLSLNPVIPSPIKVFEISLG